MLGWEKLIWYSSFVYQIRRKTCCNQEKESSSDNNRNLILMYCRKPTFALWVSPGSISLFLFEVDPSNSMVVSITVQMGLCNMCVNVPADLNLRFRLHVDVYCLFQIWTMMWSSLLLLSFLMGVVEVQGASDFRICSFNMHHFGDSKAKKNDVMQIITKVRQSHW